MRKSIFDLEASIRSIGRPESVFAPLPALIENIRAKANWDAINPTLRDRHFQLVGELEELRAEMEAAEAEMRHANRLIRELTQSGAGRRSIEAVEDPKDTPALAATREWFNGPATWLVLLGPKGCGKSVAATWSVREMLDQSATAAFRRVSEVTKLSAFDEGAKELQRLRKMKLLALDEFGVEFTSEFARAQFHELLDFRHEARAKTVLTSNLAREEVSKRLGDRLVDRIASDGVVVELGGHSLRRIS